MRYTIGCCYTPPVIVRFTVRGRQWRTRRLARGVCEGPSRMPGNWPVRFRGEGVRATLPPYPTLFHAPIVTLRKRRACLPFGNRGRSSYVLGKQGGWTGRGVIGVGHLPCRTFFVQPNARTDRNVRATCKRPPGSIRSPGMRAVSLFSMPHCRCAVE